MRRCEAYLLSRMNANYLRTLPEHIARTMPADVLLVAEGEELPAHSFVLGVNSAIFAEILSEARSTTSEPAQQLRLPLTDDSAKDVRIALTYFYMGCAVMSPLKPELQSVDDSISLARFAHKYAVTALVAECESFLVMNAHTLNGAALFTTPEVVSLLLLAESCCMETLLAHCELFMIKESDSSFWQHPALMSERISRQCLLRLLRGAQHHKMTSEAQITTLQGPSPSRSLPLAPTGFGPFGSQHAPRSANVGTQPTDSSEDQRHVSISTLIQWGKDA